MMKIVDFKKDGNIVRFYLGKTINGIYGDDWDDTPYEHNAGEVYDQFYDKTIDIAFPLDTQVFEPCYGFINSPYCKNSFISEDKVPCILFGEVENLWQYENYAELLENVPSLDKIYLGDEWEDVVAKYGDKFTVLPNKKSNQFGILFENCEYMAFDKKDVEMVELDEIYANVRFYKDETQIMRVANNVHIVLKQNADVEYLPFLVENLKTTTFKRILEHSDIVSIDLNGEECFVKFDGITSNKYQHSFIDDSGRLHIVISKDKEYLENTSL